MATAISRRTESDWTAHDTLLTQTELAKRLRVSKETVRKKTYEGLFVRGVHYIGGDGFPRRYFWSAVCKRLGLDEGRS